MFNSVLNFVFVLVVIVIFIGRTIVRARSRHRKDGSPDIPVFFEDAEYEEEEPAVENVPAREVIEQYREDSFAPYALSRGATEYFKGLQNPGLQSPGVYVPGMSPAGAANTLRVLQNQSVNSQVTVPSQPVNKMNNTRANNPSSFMLRLNYLSPLKQAVVMAEVLGPPKGMQ